MYPLLGFFRFLIFAFRSLGLGFLARHDVRVFLTATSRHRVIGIFNPDVKARRQSIFSRHVSLDVNARRQGIFHPTSRPNVREFFIRWSSYSQCLHPPDDVKATTASNYFPPPTSSNGVRVFFTRRQDSTSEYFSPDIKAKRQSIFYSRSRPDVIVFSTRRQVLTSEYIFYPMSRPDVRVFLAYHRH